MPATSLIDLKSLTAEALSRIFSFSLELSAKKSFSRPPFHATAGLLFFEPSTRTRMSFEFACAREGVSAVTLGGETGTSLEKGESFEDTVLNVAAMKPDVLIIRSGDQLDMDQLAQRLSMPIINAGWGRRGHPTQALLDAFTMQNRIGSLVGKKVLLVGDIRHSRVASSHRELSQVLNYEIAFAGPKTFLPEDCAEKTFSSLEEGLQWADVVMALRVQNERHQPGAKVLDFQTEWGLNAERVKALKADALIMHPGPVNWGVEMTADLANDRRTIILEQVTSGVFVRQALIRWALQGEMK